jgi:N-acetyl-gamma-glutamyl-phosphate reductase
MENNTNSSSHPNPHPQVAVGIIGGAGYTGGELIRLLINHPQAEIVFVNSKSNAGKYLHEVHQDLIGETNLKFTSELINNIDVLFLCLGHGDSQKFLSENTIPSNVKIIDLANDFRLAKDAQFGERKFVYGLPEINKTAIQQAQNIANPGCFATAIQLGLLPLAKQNSLSEIYTTGITGSTGAGQKLAASSHFSWRANNIQAYKTLTHQHLGEIQQSLHQLQNSFPLQEENSEALNFVPWRGDFTRGIFISSTLTCNLSLHELNNLYKDFYKDAAFTFVSDEPIFLKQVVNTNKAIIYLEKTGSKLVVHSALDNLLKGASGQAVQNMNIRLGFEETSGINFLPTAF